MEEGERKSTYMLKRGERERERERECLFGGYREKKLEKIMEGIFRLW